MMAYCPKRKGNPLTTPAGREMAVPTAALCAAIEAEWADVQGATKHGQGVPKHGQIPLTRYVNTVLDHIAQAREGAVNGWLSHAESDLLCPRAEAPVDLVARQDRVWQPYLDWLREETGVTLEVTLGLMPHRQSPAVLAVLRQHGEQLDDFRLLVLSQATSLLGSAVLALAFVCKRVDVEAALGAALLDELYQSERWGEPEELVIRRDDLSRELGELSRFLLLLDDGA